jgi:hypothetical protein
MPPDAENVCLSGVVSTGVNRKWLVEGQNGAINLGRTLNCRSTTSTEAIRWPSQCANLSRHDLPSSAWNRCAVTNYHNPAWTEESRFRGALDDLIIVPLVFVTLAANKILRFVLSILMRLLDYAFPLAMQIVWLPLFATKVLGNAIVTVINGALRFLPLSETKRRQWSISIRRNWSWLRRKISYQAFEQAVHIAFESGMAWVFRECRHLTPNTALLVILGAVLWLPFSFGVATAMHAVLFAKVSSWPAWMQLLHPLATVIAKSKLLVLPVYPAAWPQAKKHPFVQLVLKSYETIKCLYVIKKFGFRYRQTEIAGIAAVERLERTAGLASAMRWLRKAHVAKHFGVEKPTQKLGSFFSRWSIKFSAEYYEVKERQASAAPSLDGSKLRTLR